MKTNFICAFMNYTPLYFFRLFKDDLKLNLPKKRNLHFAALPAKLASASGKAAEKRRFSFDPEIYAEKSNFSAEMSEKSPMMMPSS